MRIAQVAPLYERVPPRCYGGTERVVGFLTDALVDLGHDVTLFRTADSQTRGRLVPCAPEALRLRRGQGWLAYHVLELERVFQRASLFDVIHCHVDMHHFPPSRRSSVPCVTTLNGRFDVPGLAPLYEEYIDQPPQNRPAARCARPRVSDRLARTCRHGAHRGARVRHARGGVRPRIGAGGHCRRRHRVPRRFGRCGGAARREPLARRLPERVRRALHFRPHGLGLRGRPSRAHGLLVIPQESMSANRRGGGG